VEGGSSSLKTRPLVMGSMSTVSIRYKASASPAAPIAAAAVTVPDKR
jgi:hypothetical protein